MTDPAQKTAPGLVEKIVVGKMLVTNGEERIIPIYHTTVGIPIALHNNLRLRRKAEEARSRVREGSGTSSDWSTHPSPTYRMQMWYFATPERELTGRMAGAVVEAFGLEYEVQNID